ncbi:MAG: recombinase family protein [Alphaproteobacteria bacterium]|nr:recombinase family protein [Alphaproteobacteria bacterium]MBN2780260.1 recombinase family protein [Alphaproteobacteria bacterium]
MPKINCAIYVRKSTEKGLEQEFNSLHNQEEACKNYILSQAFNNWEYFRTYEDGGISGGTMERPGLKQMMSDMASGQIQVVVVYKVDRLSRSIMDFHKMIKSFEQYGCNFVSITQSFDTSSSMGKLTLNMLLSFAQFEREVGSERVRDKIASSKAKGFWMGGVPPLGYTNIDKKLVIEENEAEKVRMIFDRYLVLKNMESVKQEMNEKGLFTKSFTTKNKNKSLGGNPWTTGRIHQVLKNTL